ncbi:TetR family transcriptional regulator [Roseimicrobium gellanilyticum]|uniref:TetR family transcriptional regulator n=1 Tax=Roseimicrobium gellanilyticum TaxID=748857 RepID=A0A366HPP0_9BACT|nr:TetR/AcrR family transcriptional regulator [Roseimicrobium gellanilyticum]RBP44430.1 TetR family transcriptional regulator [Roseimicrobium gellanilyticum]
MPLQKVSREDVVRRLLGVFRQHGYEGASLTMIAKDVGLQKASLYHLFPGGKEEMAQAVLDGVSDSLERKILAPLRGAGTPVQRLKDMTDRVCAFYGQGSHSCIFDTLSLGGGDNPFLKGIGKAMNAWARALAGLAREHGATGAVARERAERVLVTIQGTLVLARCMEDPKVFIRGLQTLPEILLPPKRQTRG